MDGRVVVADVAVVALVDVLAELVCVVVLTGLMVVVVTVVPSVVVRTVVVVVVADGSPAPVVDVEEKDECTELSVTEEEVGVRLHPDSKTAHIVVNTINKWIRLFIPLSPLGIH